MEILVIFRMELLVITNFFSKILILIEKIRYVIFDEHFHKKKKTKYEQDDTGTCALSGLCRPAVFR